MSFCGRQSRFYCRGSIKYGSPFNYVCQSARAISGSVIDNRALALSPANSLDLKWDYGKKRRGSQTINKAVIDYRPIVSGGDGRLHRNSTCF